MLDEYIDFIQKGGYNETNMQRVFSVIELRTWIKRKIDSIKST